MTYNWFCFRKGDSFSDFTVGQPAYRIDFPGFVQEGKIVKEIKLLEEESNKRAEVIFEDNSITYQENLNSWTYEGIPRPETDTREDKA